MAAVWTGRSPLNHLHKPSKRYPLSPSAILFFNAEPVLPVLPITLFTKIAQAKPELPNAFASHDVSTLPTCPNLSHQSHRREETSRPPPRLEISSASNRDAGLYVSSLSSVPLPSRARAVAAGGSSVRSSEEYEPALP